MSLLLAYVGYALKLSFLFIPQVFIPWGFLSFFFASNAARAFPPGAKVSPLESSRVLPLEAPPQTPGMLASGGPTGGFTFEKVKSKLF